MSMAATTPAAAAFEIRERITAELAEEGIYTGGINWTGGMFYCIEEETTYFEFTAPEGSWDSHIWAREDREGSLLADDVDDLRRRQATFH